MNSRPSNARAHRATRTGSHIGSERRTATVTVLFCDLVASTERQQALGDDAADVFRRRFFAALHAASSATHGEVVKTMGDGMMVVFRHSAVDAIACASRMHDEVAALDVEPPALLRVGVSAGEIAAEDGDWYGTPVVEAARLCAIADVGQTLVTDVVRALVGTRGGHQLRPVGPMRLKGLAEPVAVATVVREPVTLPRAVPAPVVRPILPERAPMPADKKKKHGARWWAAIITAPAVAAAGIAFVATRSHSSHARVTVAANYTPRLGDAPCSSTVRAVVPNAKCGFVSVPENRARPSGRWINVNYTRYPARHAPASNDPVIEVATALDNAEIVDDPAQSPIRDDADLIVFGGRGLGSSSPSLTCPEFAKLGPEILRHPENDPSTIARGQAALRACHDHWTSQGVALDHYTMVDEAADVVDLAAALDLRHVNLQGVWDGARVALEVARDAPGIVRSLFLLDPEVPRSSFMTNPTASLGAAFDRFVAVCEGDRKCHDAYPNLAQAFRNDVTAQDANPQNAIPTDVVSSSVLRVAVKQPTVLLDGDRIAQGLAAAFTASSRNMPLVPAAITHANTIVNASLALAQNFPLVLKDFAWGGFLSRMCSYEVHTRSAGADVAASARPEFAGYDDPAFRWTCDAWDVPQAPAASFAPVSSDAPTLVVGEGFSPRWQPEAASQLRAGLSHMSVLTFATLPGGALPGDFPSCYNDIRREFVRDPSRALDTDACARQTPKIDFVAS
jgi:class 3 adenylate cyclase/pimeloyl-ACP methyl ester carboxylesterase